mgnify:CR=1 FL=1
MKTKTNTLSTTAISAIAASFVDALSTNESTGSLVTQVCDVARKYLRGEAMSDDDRADIVTKIASARGWKKNVLKQRSSEVNVVLKAYHELPEAIKLLSTKNNGRAQWHDSMKLARRINAGDSITKAVAFALKKSSGAGGNPAGRVAGALKAWWNDAPRKRAEIIKAAQLLGLTIKGVTE